MISFRVSHYECLTIYDTTSTSNIKDELVLHYHITSSMFGFSAISERSYVKYDTLELINAKQQSFYLSSFVRCTLSNVQ